MEGEKSCSWPDCYPEDTGCQCGEKDYTKCKHYKKQEGSSEISEDITPNQKRFSWTGSAMGLHDLNYITSSSNVIIIGVVGVAKTGKTTFLALLYCLLRHGYKIGNFSFAGSYTLTGWEDISFNLKWKAEDPKIQFPPHTTSNAGRIPGLLHLALKNEDGIIYNVIFTDAPGEWFKDWSINKKALKSEGANWIYSKADAFLMFADRDKLSGTERGSTRNMINQLLVRLKENIKDRPVCLVWSKSDIEIETSIKNNISNYFTSNFNNNREFDVSARNDNSEWHENVLNSVSYIINSIVSRQNSALELPVILSNDLFLARRR